MHIVIIGAGLIGISSAWFLRQAGYEVTVLDRQAGAGLETSFANGGQISVSHSEPWATPANLRKAITWLGREDAPLLLRLHWDWRQWLWLAQFIRECTDSRVQRNIAAMIAIASESQHELHALRASLKLEYSQRNSGILHFYQNQKLFTHAQKHAEWMHHLGCERIVYDTNACIELEPTLAPHQTSLKGGIYTASDEIGDAHLFTQALAKHCLAAGVQFLYQYSVNDFIREKNQIIGVRCHTPNGTEIRQADQFVLAAGSYSPLLVAKLGLYLPVYPGKGYSHTYHLSAGIAVPSVSLLDESSKIVFSRLDNRLRVAGTAELNGYDLSLNPHRLANMQTRTLALFPQLADCPAPEAWCGLRPSTPSNVPIIGKSKLNNLWMNTGHGTLGWTMAVGSGKRLAQAIQTVVV